MWQTKKFGKRDRACGEQLKDRLIFCEWIADDVKPTMIDSTLLISDTVLPIKLIRLNNFSPLYTALASNKNGFL